MVDMNLSPLEYCHQSLNNFDRVFIKYDYMNINVGKILKDSPRNILSDSEECCRIVPTCIDVGDKMDKSSSESDKIIMKESFKIVPMCYLEMIDEKPVLRSLIWCPSCGSR